MIYRGPVTFGHNSYEFNQHLDSAGAAVTAHMTDAAILDDCPINSTYRDLRSPLHLVQGASLGAVHKGMTILQPQGRLIVPVDTSPRPTLEDRKRAFLAAFDPYLCYIDSPSTDGAYALDFYEGTTDTGTWASGYIPARYYCRPSDKPKVMEQLKTRNTLPFQVGLIAPDPRMYHQTALSLTLTTSTTSGSLTHLGTTPGPIKLTITMGGAGATNFTVSDGTLSFVLDLSGCASGDVVVVVMETCGPWGEGKLITKNSTRAFSLKTSSAATWLALAAAGSTTYTISHTTNLTSCVIAAYSTWA